MTVAVLNPQDSFIKGYRFSKQPLISPTKGGQNSNPNFLNNNRSNRTQQQPPPNRTKRSPPSSHRNSPPLRTAARKSPSKANLVMGQVKIMKRGEELTVTMASHKPVLAEPEKKSGPAVQNCANSDVGSTEKLRREHESVSIKIPLTESKQGAANFYAGSAFITSPPPSSLPMPAFFTKKSFVTFKNDDATSDLRRILKLDIL